MSQLVAPKLNIPSLGHSPSGGSASGLGFSPGSSALSGFGGGHGLGSQTSVMAPSLGADTTQRLIAELHMNKQGPTPTSGGLGSYRSSNSGLGVRSMLESPRRATSPTNNTSFQRLYDDKTTLATSSSMPLFRKAEVPRTMSSGDSTSSDEYEMLTAEGLARAHGGGGNLTTGEVGYVMPTLSLDRSSLSGSSVSSDLSGSASASRAQAAAQLAKAKASYEQAKQPEASMMGGNHLMHDSASQNGSSRQQPHSVDLTVAHAAFYESEADLQAAVQDSPSRSRFRSSLPSNIGASMRNRDHSGGLRFSEGMVNVDLMADQPLLFHGDSDNLSSRSQQGQQDLIRASSSTSLPPRASSKGSVAGSSVGAGVLANDNSENLTQALTAFGAPSEWYHDSIILGRLSALALRYFHAKASRKPWQAWRAFTRSERNRKRNFLRNLTSACRRVAFRKFRWQVLSTDDRTDDRNRIIGKARWIPLLNVLSNLPVILLRPTWTRLRQAIFMRRDLHRRLRLLTLINSKMKQMLARTHYYEHLQRSALAAFWLAKEVRINSRFSRDTPARRSSGSTVATTTVHVAQVLRRSWRRWFYGVRLWMSSAEYAVRETELWLTGEISTPRDIVTNSVMQVVSPETHVANNGLSDNFLGYGGAWNLGRASVASFAGKRSRFFTDERPRYDGTPYQEQEDQLILPFPQADVDSRKDDDRRTPRNGSEAGDSTHGHRHRAHRKTSPMPVDSSSRSHYENLIASFRSKVQTTTKPRRKGEEESPVTVPPTRQRRSLVFEQTRQVALENEIDRSRREYEEEASRLMQSPLVDDIGEQSRGSPRHHRRLSPMRDEEAWATQRRDRRLSSSMGNFNSELAETYSDDDMTFVDGRRHVEGQSAKSSPFYNQGSYDFAHDPANDYWALRNRRGPGAKAKEISLRR